MSIIEVQNLVKKYKKSTSNAVDDISFSVKEGEFFAFLGPNGAGKTTTISILTTTLAKTSGTLILGGYNVDTQPSQVRSNIGVIFQNPSLDLNLTAEENIRFHTFLYKLYGFKPTFGSMSKEYKDKVMQLSEILGLQDDMFKPTKSFSGGMRRKLELMRTLIHKPKVLFLDEPTSGLDPLSRKNLWNYLRGIRQQENLTIFLTTHYLEEAEDADRVCIINHGKIIINDTIENIKNRLVKDYVYLESDNIDALATEISNLGFRYSVSGPGINVYISNGDIQKLIKSINTKLNKIHIVQPSLEEVYLGLIKDSDQETK